MPKRCDGARPGTKHVGILKEVGKVARSGSVLTRFGRGVAHV